MTTNIEWARNPDGTKGETWPVVTGCTHAGSPGCDMCYAARMAATRLRDHPRYKGLATFHNGKARWTGKINLNHDVLEQPLHFRKPRMIFVASMGDLFHDNVPFWFVRSVWTAMALCPQHVFQVLTKRPERMFQFVSREWPISLSTDEAIGKSWPASAKPSPILPNVWLGTSIENQEQFDSRWYWASQIPAAVLFVSCEPLLGSVKFNARNWERLPDWVICGGESGPGARPMNPGWARSLRDQCQVTSTPYFLKQWGEYLGIDYTGEKVAGVPMWTRADGLSGQIGKRPEVDFGDDHGAVRVGRKRAGRLLDGQVWDQFPEHTL